jgi:hypothetical protein
MGFRSLQHIKVRRSTYRRLYLPATFRLQGLVTLLTAYSLRARAGSVSHRRRSWDYPSELTSRKVSTAFPQWIHPPTVPPAVVPNAVATDRPGKPRLLGVDPSGSSCRPAVGLAHRAQDTPLGFALLGFSRNGLGQDFARPPLARFSPGRRIAKKLRPRVSISPCLASPYRRSELRLWAKRPF